MKKYIMSIKLEIFLQIICSAIGSIALAKLACFPKSFFDSLSKEMDNVSIA